MKKFSVLVLVAILALGLVACTKTVEASGKGIADEMTPSVAHEELKKEVNFETAQFTTAQDGEVTIQTKQAEAAEGIQTPQAEGAVKDSASLPSDSGTTSGGSATSGGNSTAVAPKSSAANSGTASSSNFTLPDAVQRKDNSLGTLSIPKINLEVPIYETDNEMEDMAYGVAHFKETSCWDGNVGLAGHNQGVNTYFGQIHTLVVGDTMSLTTSLGTRTYAVVKSMEIDETDWSTLGRTEENQLTLITCVNHDLTKRLCVQAVEIP